MEISVLSFIHIMNFSLKHIESIIPWNLILAKIIEQSADLFVAADFRVEELRFWTPFDKVNKCSDIITRIHLKILGKIVDLYSTRLFSKQTKQ